MLCLWSHKWKAEVQHQAIRKFSLEEGESLALDPAAYPGKRPVHSVQDDGLASGRS
jgi:hypothetical protein